MVALGSRLHRAIPLISNIRKRPGLESGQPRFSTKSARVIARKIGAKAGVADCLADPLAANLRAVVKKMAAALVPI